MRAAMQRGDWAAAIAAGETFLQQGRTDWMVSLNLAVSASRARHGSEQAWLEHAHSALEHSNHHPQARLGAAEIYGALGFWEQQLALLTGLPRPEPWVSLHMRTAALARLGRMDEAMAVLESWPEDQREWPWRMVCADVHVQACRWIEAEAAYRAVLAERPQQAEAHVNLALVLLTQRRCAEAWSHYEWRRSNPRLNQFGMPELLPSLEALSDQHVILQGEQGIGDQIMASRYIQPLSRVCRRLTVVPAPRLASLLGRHLPDHVNIALPGDDLDPGIVIGLSSLPLLFWPSLGLATPCHTGYLHADSRLMSIWRLRLQSLPAGLKIGLGWLGGTTGAERRERALSSADFLELGRWPGVQWIDLQFLTADAQYLAERSREAGLHRFGEPGLDLDESLALIACLDGVLTTRQTVAHLTGALGKSGQVLVPARPEWRYWGDNDRWAWYPSMQLVHQQARGDWQSALSIAARQWLKA